MIGNSEYNSYSNIKRLSDSELESLWISYLADKSNKKLGCTGQLNYCQAQRFSLLVHLYLEVVPVLADPRQHQR